MGETRLKCWPTAGVVLKFEFMNMCWSRTLREYGNTHFFCDL